MHHEPERAARPRAVVVVASGFRELSIPALRVGLVLLTFGVACFAVAGSKTLVTSFNGSVSSLHAAKDYGDQAATTLAWVLVVVALLFVHRAATRADVRRSTRVGLRVAIAGTLLMALQAACALWSAVLVFQPEPATSPLANALGTTSALHDALQLNKVSWILGSAGWLVLTAAALLARPATQGRASDRSWRTALGVLGLSFVLAAVMPASTFVFVVTNRAVNASQVTVLTVNVPSVLAWFAIAFALLVAGGALRADEDARPLAVAAPVGALGALLVAASATASLISAELLLTGVWFGWHPNLGKVLSTSAWAGYVCLTIAFGLAAVKLEDRRAVRLMPLPRRADGAWTPATVGA